MGERFPRYQPTLAVDVLPPALQLYTIRRALEAAPGPTLDQVVAAGFQSVEVAPPPPNISHAQLAKELRTRNLRVVAIHAELPVESAARRILEEIGAYDCRHLIWHGWPKNDDADSVDGWRRLADSYVQAANNAAQQGFQFGLHNHWWECERLLPDGPYRYQLLDQWLPREIFFEVDVYWAQTAGLNPTVVLKDLAHRLHFVHLKDGPTQHGKSMTALGEGRVDIAGILRHLPAAIQTVIELDECDSDPLSAAERSLRFVREARRP